MTKIDSPMDVLSMSESANTATEWADYFGAPPCNCPPQIGPYHGAACPRGQWWNNEGLMIKVGLGKDSTDSGETKP
jgi:hypothetical protein